MPPQKPMIEELDTTGNVSADDSSSPEKKDIKEEVQSIYHRIFAERGPNKRKIKVRKIEEMPLELNGPDSDSEYQDSHDSTDTDDATIVSSELQNINSESDDAEKEEDESLSVSDTEDQSQRIKDWLTSWKVNDPGVCCICLDSATTEDNVLVYCDNDECEVVTHQECYGIIDLPGAHDPWYCDRCLAKPSECVSCCLCPNKNGAFRRLSRGADSGGWVHVVCALWMPGMWIGDNELISDITVEHVQQNNWRKSCCVCSSGLRDEGAVVHCDAGGCKNWLHVTCAQSLSLLEVVEDDPNMADPYFIYCPQHGSHAGEDPRLNAWERWYRKRDEFLLNARKKEGLARTRRVNVEDDIGMTLRELFEDRYCDYRERREQRIAQTRRRVAEGAAIVNGIKDQIVKNEQALVEISSKVESGEQERQALIAYIEEITPCLHILTKAMLRTDGLAALMSDIADVDDDIISQFIALSGGPLVWTTRGEQIAKSIDINSLDISILNPLGLSMPDESPPPEIVYRKRRGRRRRNVVDVKGKAKSTLDQPVRNGRGRPRGSTNKNKVVRVRKTGGTRGRPRKTAILNRSSEASVASASGSKDPAFDRLDRAESVISIEDDADSPIHRNMDTNREIVITSDEDMEVDGVANGKSTRNANANGVHKDRIRSGSKVLADDNTIGSSGHTDISTTYTSNINNLLNSPLPDFVDGTQSPSSLSVGSIDAASNDKTPVKDSANATETNRIDLFTTIQPPHYKNAGDETTAQTSATGGIPSPVSSADEKLSTPSKVHVRQSTVSTSSGSLSGNLPKKRGRKRKRPIEKSPTDRDENSQGTMNGNMDYSDDNNSDTHSIGYDKSNHTNSHQNLYNSEFPRSGTSSNEGIRGYNPVNGNSRSHYTSERRMNHTAISHRHKSAFSSRSHSATEIREDSPPRKVRRTRAQERPKAVRRTKSQGQSEDKMTTHAKSSLAPVVPQPICVCCAEVQAPDERSTATLVSPVRARASTIVKGRDKVHRMIRCNFCTKWYHLACMNPPIRTMPSSGYIWRCEDCDGNSEEAADKPGEATDSSEDSKKRNGRKWKLRSRKTSAVTH